MIFKAPLEEWVAVRSLPHSMKESFKFFQVERINEEGRREETFTIAEKPVALFLNDEEVVGDSPKCAPKPESSRIKISAVVI